MLCLWSRGVESILRRQESDAQVINRNCECLSWSWMCVWQNHLVKQMARISLLRLRFGAYDVLRIFAAF